MSTGSNGAREAEVAAVRRGTLPFRTLLAVALQRGSANEAHCRIVLELLSTATSLRTALRASLAGLRLTELEVGVLLSLFALEPDPGTPAQLAEQISCSRKAVAAALDGLHARALVRRSREGGARRVTLVQATRSGRAATESVLVRFMDYATRVARQVPADAAQVCISVCHQLNSAAPRRHAPRGGWAP